MKSTPNGYRDMNEVKGRWVYTMTGARFGDMATAGAYVGQASYLISSDTDVRMTTNTVTASTTQTARVERGNSNFGAPLEFTDICIAEIVDGKSATQKKKGLKSRTQFHRYEAIVPLNAARWQLQADSLSTKAKLQKLTELHAFEVDKYLTPIHF